MSYGKKWKSRSKRVSPFGLKTWMNWRDVRQIYWDYVIPKKELTIEERHKIWNHYFYYYDVHSVGPLIRWIDIKR